MNKESATPKKLYRCPNCGETLTDEEWKDTFETGGYGYCLCKFMGGERIVTDYDVYILQERS